MARASGDRGRPSSTRAATGGPVGRQRTVSAGAETEVVETGGYRGTNRAYAVTMSTRWWTRLVVLGVLVPGSGSAERPRAPDRPAAHAATAVVAAHPARHRHRPPARHRRKHRSGTVARATPQVRPPAAPRSNMPAGWEWPPSPAMATAGKACTDRLDALGVPWLPAAAIEKIATPITVPSMMFGAVKVVSQFRKAPFVMDCQLALTLTTFAPDLYALGIRQLTFSRIYGYTLARTQGRTGTALSRHALGLAIDIRSVIDADGHESVVVRDYTSGDPLLLALETFLDGSAGFRTVLTPKNDPISHYDHFHVEVAVSYGP